MHSDESMGTEETEYQFQVKHALEVEFSNSTMP